MKSSRQFSLQTDFLKTIQFFNQFRKDNSVFNAYTPVHAYKYLAAPVKKLNCLYEIG